jgi:limonene-1,2-epoxide hydrolase
MLMAHDENHRDEWKERFQTVGRAQVRYLYVLMIVAAFYWALHVQVMSTPSASPTEQELPLVGVKVNRAVVWGTAPTILGLIVLATLGTFHALTRASEKLGTVAQGDDAFERLDTAPTAIDFIIYTESRWWLSRLGLFSYPIALSVVWVEAIWVWLSVYRGSVTFPGRGVFLILGAAVLILCLPLLFGLWASKGKSVFIRKETRMPSKEIHVVKAFIAAINRHDPTGLSDLMTEDHTFVDSGGTTQSGREAMKAGWEEYFRMFPDYTIKVETMFQDRAVVAVFGSASGTYNGRRGPVPENRIDMPAAWKAVVENGKVKLWQVYADWTEGCKIIEEDKRWSE